jgi:hypothetical protein
MPKARDPKRCRKPLSPVFQSHPKNESHPMFARREILTSSFYATYKIRYIYCLARSRKHRQAGPPSCCAFQCATKFCCLHRIRLLSSLYSYSILSRARGNNTLERFSGVRQAQPALALVAKWVKHSLICVGNMKHFYGEMYVCVPFIERERVC